MGIIGRILAGFDRNPVVLHVRGFFRMTAMVALATLAGTGVAFAAPAVITSFYLPDGAVNEPYSATLTASGDIVPGSWSITGLLSNSGLSINPVTGKITGIPSFVDISNTSVTVSVDGTDGQTASKTLTLRIELGHVDPPTITNIIGNNAPTTGGPQSSFIEGTSLVAATRALIGGTFATVSVSPATHLTVTSVPPGVDGPTTLTVLNAGGSASVPFYYYVLPQVSGVTPDRGPLEGGNSVVITGAGFEGVYADVNSVKFGGISAAFTIDSDSQITATVPAGVLGAAAITVAKTIAPFQNKTATLPNAFNYLPSLQIDNTGLPGAVPFRFYPTVITASGGQSPYSFSATGLPTGLTLQSNGTFSGTPTTVDSYDVTFTVTDQDNVQASRTLTLDVNKIASTVTVAPDLTTTDYGDRITFDISVAATGEVPSGTGQVLVDGNPIRTYSLLLDGTARIIVDDVPAGNHQLTATYGGNNILLPSATTVSVPFMVTARPTTTSLSGSPTGQVGPGTAVTYRAQVVPNGGAQTPTGTALFSVDGTASGASVPLINGAAEKSITISSAGAITVEYQPDANFLPSVSAPLNQAVTTTAPVTGDVTAAVPPFSDANVIAPTVTGAFDTLHLASLPTHGLVGISGNTFVYNPADGFSGTDSFTYKASNGSVVSNISTVTVTVTPMPTTTTLTLSSPTVNIHAGVTATATVVRTGDGSPATGSVRFNYDDTGTPIGTFIALNASGVAALALPTPTRGGTSVTATYVPDASYLDSSDSQTFTVVAPVTIVASSDLPTATEGALLHLSAQLTADDGSVPTGQVEFFSDGVSIGLSGIDISGGATITNASLTPGPHAITASFNPSGDYRAATSSAITQKIVSSSAVDIISFAPGNPVFGDSVTLTAAVTATTTPTGMVDFIVDGVSAGTATLNGGGFASLAVPGLDAGSHSVAAHYLGDGNVAPSTAPTVNISVAQADTVTTLVMSPNADLTAGVTATATVLRIDNSAPATGTIRFDYDGTPGPQAPLDASGVATVTLPTPARGTHQVEANYLGNIQYVASADDGVVDVLSPVVVSVILPTPTAAEHAVISLLAQLTAADGSNPTGTVEFFSDGSSIGLGGIDGSGVAEIGNDNLTPGSHAITAAFTPSGYYLPWTSVAATQTIMGSSSVTTTFTPANPVIGDDVTLTATVTSTATPTGTVDFIVNGASAGTATLDGSGVATLVLHNLATDLYKVVSRYQGDSATAPAEAPLVNVYVARTPTILALSASPDHIVFGDSVQLIAELTSNGSPLVGASVHFEEDYGVDFSPLGFTLTDANGQAVITAPLLNAGHRTIRVHFAGSAVLAPANKPLAALEIAQAGSTVSLTASVNPTMAGQTTTLTAQIGGGIFPVGGDVTFFDGATNLGTSSVTARTASLDIGTLAVGSHSLTAVFNGDQNVTSSTSPVLTQVVDAPVLTVSPATLPSGQAGVAFSAPLSTTGGTAPYLYALSGQPNGLSLDPTTGVISGIPKEAGSFNTTATATDANGLIGTANHTLIIDPPSILLPAAALPDAGKGQSYSQGLPAPTGGNAPYGYAITGGALPTGILLNPTTGALSGIPTVSGSFSFDVSATDSTGGGPFAGVQTYALSVGQQAPVAVADTYGTAQDEQLIVAAPGVLGNDTDTEGDPLSAVLATAPASGTFNLQADGSFTFTPAAGFAGTESFTYRADDGTTQSNLVTVGINVAVATPVAGPISLNVAYGSSANTITPALSGGAADSLAIATPPTHGSANVSGLTITYTPDPTFTGTDSFTYTATNGSGPSAQASVTITVDPPTSVVLPTTILANARVGQSYSAMIDPATGGSGSYTYQVVGPLPAWLTFDPATRLFSGTPTAVGSVALAIRATDTSTGDGPFTADQTYALAVGVAQTALALSSSHNPANLGDSVTLTAAITPASATGTIAFLVDGVEQSPQAVISSGTASFTTSLLTAGDHQITARYDGDANHAATLSTALTQSVQSQGSLTIRVEAQGTDAIFGFTSPTPQLNLSLATRSGHGDSGAINLTAGTYALTADDMTGAGFALTGLSCNDSDSVGDMAARTANIVLGAGESLICTFAAVNSRDETTALIADFLDARAEMILANQPDAQRRIDRLNGIVETGGELGPALLGYLPGLADGGPLDVSTSLGAINRMAGNQQPNPLDLWLEGTFALFDGNKGEGQFNLATMGADYLVNPDLLIGGFIQVDGLTEQIGDSNASASGTGWLAGPYATMRLGENLYLDLLAGIGTSSNSIKPFGTYADDFDTTRFLLSASLQGQWQTGDFTLSPRARFNYFGETTQGYTDSLGVDIPAVSSGLGQLAVGSGISYRMTTDGNVVIDTGLRFDGVLDISTASGATRFDNAHGRIEGSLDFTLPGGARLGLSAAYDGLGSDDLHATSAKITLGAPMN